MDYVNFVDYIRTDAGTPLQYRTDCSPQALQNHHNHDRDSESHMEGSDLGTSPVG